MSVATSGVEDTGELGTGRPGRSYGRRRPGGRFIDPGAPRRYPPAAGNTPRTFLFLQEDISPFFPSFRPLDVVSSRRTRRTYAQILHTQETYRYIVTYRVLLRQRIVNNDLVVYSIGMNFCQSGGLVRVTIVFT